MAKVVHCRDLGFDCEGVIRAETAKDALAQAAEHARTVHSLTEISPEVVQAVRSAIRDK
jgi:predicted small metal-binding protein